ncbi:MAG: disulfide bond formation protein B [Gammaproteobacteria bacterium]|nr:disulfide bond formation protein B [Gammaproteobacteria bacterium]
MLSSRGLFFLGFLFCASMLFIAGYFQFVDHLEPCPLCILQRVFTLFVGVVLLIAVIHNPAKLGIRIYGAIAGLLALIGAGVSARHVWLQNLPEDQVPSCGPGLNFMLDNFPLTDAINMVMRGSGECAEVLWTFMGLSIPSWTLIAFVSLAVLTLSQIFRKQS